MSDNPNEITYFAETDYRNKKQRFGIKASDRTRHMYIIGKSGMGKSTLLENMAIQDIQNGNGLAFIDPHGGTAEKLLEYIPQERVKDVIYFAPFDTEYPIAFNVMEDVGYDKRHLVVSGLMSAFEKIWADAWSARMSYILQNTLFALLEYPDSTLLDINRMLTDKNFRKKVVDNVKDTTVKSYWVDEFAKYTDQYTRDAVPAIQNKVGQFATSPLIRNVVGQPKSSFDIRKVMDEKKILIMNLSKGRIGDVNTRLLGSMLITKIYLTGMSRADLSHIELAKKPNFYFYVDEFQSFANKSFAEILSEARKYKLNLIIAHQYVEQMEDEVRSAVFGNVGTMITFRIGSYDAEIFEKEFAPEFTSEDFVNLDYTQIYLKLMIDGISSKPFSATTLPPIPVPETSNMDKVIEMSRKQFATPRAEVEEFINRRQQESFTGTGANSQDKRMNYSGNAESAKYQKGERKGGYEATKNKYAENAHKKTNAQHGRSVAKESGPKNESGENMAFKKAFENMDIKKIERTQDENNAKEQRVSLDNLKTKKQKSANSENKKALKEALAGILSEREVATKLQKSEKQSAVSDKAAASQQPQKIPPTTTAKQQEFTNQDFSSSPTKTAKESITAEVAKNKQREIPEDVLKKVLGRD